MPLHPKHLESLLGKVLSAPPLPRHSSYSVQDLCTSVLIPIHHLLFNKKKKKNKALLHIDLDSKMEQKRTMTMCCSNVT